MYALYGGFSRTSNELEFPKALVLACYHLQCVPIYSISTYYVRDHGHYAALHKVDTITATKSMYLSRLHDIRSRRFGVSNIRVRNDVYVGRGHGPRNRGRCPSDQ